MFLTQSPVLVTIGRIGSDLNSGSSRGSAAASGAGHCDIAERYISAEQMRTSNLLRRLLAPPHGGRVNRSATTTTEASQLTDSVPEHSVDDCGGIAHNTGTGAPISAGPCAAR